MTGVKRKAAAFGFSLLGSLVLLMLCGVKTACAGASVLIVLTTVFLLLRRPAALYLLTCTAAFTAGALLLAGFDGLRYAPSLRYTGEDIAITGTAADFPQDHLASQCVVLKDCVFDGTPTKVSVAVYYTDGSGPLPEDTVSLTASEVFSSVKRDSRFFYHTLSGGTWLSAFAKSGIRIETPASRSWLFRVKELRHRVFRKAVSYMSADLAAVSAAIVTGDRDKIPAQIADSFRRSGVSHLFAVSGMHLALWTGLLFAVLRKRSRIRLLPNLLALLFIWLYAAFTGFSPSVIRAGIMLSLVCIGGVIRRHADPLNSLGLSAAVMLVFDPWLAGNVSFLLSFTATFAIVGVFPLLYERESAEGKLLKGAFLSQKEGLLLGAVVLCATLPCSAWFFGYLAALSPVMSLLCTPLAELMMVFSALGAAMPAGWALTRGVYTVAASLANALVKLTEKAASLTFAVFPLRQDYIAVWFVISVAVLLLLRYRLKASRGAVLNTLLALWAAALLTGIVLTGLRAGDYTVLIPDAGNASMISVVSGTGARSLVLGCGGDYEAYAGTRDFLQARTAFSPDYIIVPRDSKPENANLTELLKHFPPETLLLPEGAPPVRGMPERTYHCSGFSGEPLRDVALHYETAADFCAGVITINRVKTVFCLYPASDFTGRNDDYRSGDYLICRGAIPETLDAERFGTVIVLSDHSAQILDLPPNAVSTADTGDITLTLRRQRQQTKEG